jgi:hypothetical protein
LFTGRDTALTGSARKPTALSLGGDEDLEREVRRMTVGMMLREREDIAVVVGEFFRMDRGWVAVVRGASVVWDGMVGEVTCLGKD